VVKEESIRTESCPRCILCGSNGTLIYSSQQDRLFGVTGVWDFKICSNPDCKLIWLDPMPITEDLGKAYANYYTHTTKAQTGRMGLLKRVYRLMKRGYLADKYQYETASKPWLAKTIGKLLYLFPIRRGTVDDEVRYLPAVVQGRLLDVGCGSGEWLMTMRQLGWQVEGIDFDSNAISVAKENGLEAGIGSLEQQKFPASRFDAVTLNHVIEHVPDPVLTLTECCRILRPGGRLVLCTPNGASLGHRLFKKNWRGLEPPRHLHIFSTATAVRLLELSGFNRIRVIPQVSCFVIQKSLLLKWGQAEWFRAFRLDFFMRILAHFVNGVEFCLTKWNPSFAECMAVIAVKE
jgi:2-polyprenyl-3-methyl-5-hydroxy-6-metoxy-1,4-benzoquinol methylase